MTLLTPEWSRNLRDRASHPNLAAARQALDARLEAYHASLPPVPDQQAGYYHDYFCAEHATQLRFDHRSPRRHVCPVDGAVFSGEPYDSAWLWSVNDMLSDAALKFAFRSHLEAGASRARADGGEAIRILETCARRYLHLKPAPTVYEEEPGIATWQNLDESVWISRLCWAYALLGETLSGETRELVTRQLFRPAARHIRRVRCREIHNVSNWNNAALVTLARILEDDRLLEEALHGELGLAAQLERGVTEEGLWWEVSLSYHYYSLDAIVRTLRILRATGRSFDDGGVLRRMFLAPIIVALPDLRLPSVNDCWHFIGLEERVGHGIPDADGFYETAYAWFRDPAFAWVLKRNHRSRARTCFEALLDGAPVIPDGEPPARVSRLLPEAGLAVLRGGGRKRRNYLLLKAGHDGGVHGHRDQLRVQLAGSGTSLIPDLGTPGYGIDLNHTWYQQTASHATVLVDGESQPPTRGRFDRFSADDRFTLVEASACWEEGAYAGVRMRRIILWRETHFVDLFEVLCPSERDLYWVCHLQGELLRNGPSLRRAAPLSGEGGLRHVRLAGETPESQESLLSWRHPGGRLDLHLAGPFGRLLVGDSPSNPASRRLSTVARRRRAPRTVFVSVFALAGKDREPAIREVKGCWREERPWRLVLTTARGTEEWLIGSDSGEIQLVN